MPVYEVTLSTTIHVTVPVHAPNEDAAREDALDGDVLPRHIVAAAPAEGCPAGTTVSVANKAWEVDAAEAVDDTDDET